MKEFTINKAKDIRSLPAGYYVKLSPAMARAIFNELGLSGDLPKPGYARPFCIFAKWSTEIHNNAGRYEILRFR